MSAYNQNQHVASVSARRRKRARQRGQEDHVFRNLSNSQYPRPITLSITTRGIGLTLCRLYPYILSSHPNGFRSTRVPDIFALYRVFLGMLEYKLASPKIRYPPSHYNCILPHRRYNDIFQSIRQAPIPISRIINAIGELTHEDKIYSLGVAAAARDSEGSFIPRPENIVLSNLRDTVLALSDDSTPISYRKEFHLSNPIPGVIWSDDHLILNPNEIIPEEYDSIKDAHDYSSFMLCRYLDCNAVDYDSSGKASLLVSNRMETLKVPDRRPGEDPANYGTRCFPEGNVESYYALTRLTDEEISEGQVNLLGEYPEPANLRYPVYHMRDEAAASYGLPSDYLVASMRMISEFQR